MENESEGEKTFILYWLDSTTECIKGRSIEEAFLSSGYNKHDVEKLYYYKEVKKRD